MLLPKPETQFNFMMEYAFPNNKHIPQFKLEIYEIELCVSNIIQARVTSR